MNKRIIEVAKQIAQNVEDNCRIDQLASGNEMYLNGFHAAIMALQDCPEFDLVYRVDAKLDLSNIPPQSTAGIRPVSYDEATADFMKEYPQYRDDFDVQAGDRVLYARKHSDIGLFSVGQYVTVKLIAASDGAIQVSGSNFCTWINRTTFFDAFDPAPADDPDFAEVKSMKDRIADGEFDGDMGGASGREVWYSPVDGRPHSIDKDGWITARGYNPTLPGAMVQRKYPSGYEYEGGGSPTVSCEIVNWAKVYKFKFV